MLVARTIDTLTQSTRSHLALLNRSNTGTLSDTSSTLTPGALVVNTAISRARKHLRIFCDQDFWAQRRSPDSLLTALSIRG